MSSARRIDRFEFERTLWTAGVDEVAGVDEAGRGPLAGPVVAAAVVLPRAWLESGLPPELEGLNDSKELTVLRRERFFEAITRHPDIRWSTASATADVIDRVNILQATHRAMGEAVAVLRPGPAHVLVDGIRVASLDRPQTAIVKGDSKSYSVAAASVVAKVTRDRLMDGFHLQWPEYGFADHKGYGTPRHMEALRKYGPCPIHRRSFAPVKSAERDLFLPEGWPGRFGIASQS